MGANILVVEDTPHNLELIRYLLDAHGHTVIPATHGQQAVDLARANPPDLVVMDIQLADSFDGYEALRLIRTDPRLRALPVVAVTAFAMEGDRETALAAGFNGYLTKPLNPRTFVAEVDLHLPAELRGRHLSADGDREPDGTAPAPRTNTPHPAPHGRLILVVDDLPTNNELMRSILQSRGYRVRSAQTIEEALASARAEHPALVLSDLHLGHQSGIDLARQLRSSPEFADVVIAFTTSTGRLSDLDSIADVAVILRPIEPEALLRRVAELLAGHATE